MAMIMAVVVIMMMVTVIVVVIMMVVAVLVIVAMAMGVQVFQTLHFLTIAAAFAHFRPPLPDFQNIRSSIIFKY